MPDYKQQAAEEAAKLIQPGSTIGLGAGSTMIHLISALQINGLTRSITVATSSFTTRQILLQQGLNVKESAWLSRRAYYDDACEQFAVQRTSPTSAGCGHTP